jgi:hypothetical protein
MSAVWPYLRRYMLLYEGILMFVVWAKHVQTHVCQLYCPYLCKHMPLCRGMHMLAFWAILAQTHASI